jgi:hypothetical protein
MLGYSSCLGVIILIALFWGGIILFLRAVG